MKVAGLSILALALFGTGCTEEPSVPALTWYINPDNGGQALLAEQCSRASGGKYTIRVSILPSDATAQREQLVRRLAASDSSIDVMSIDLPFVAELAAAGFLRSFRAPDARALSRGMLAGPLESVRWAGRLFAVPFSANTQLLWFRKSIVARTNLNLASEPVTWTELVKAAVASGTSVEVQGRKYEGYLVWINALVASGGGKLLVNPQAGRDVTPGIDAPAGRRAAEIISLLAHSRAANPDLSAADEEAARLHFQGVRGGFMVNWPYVYGAAHEAVESGALSRAILDDIGWARYPRVESSVTSRPPLGGIALGVSAFSRHSEESVAAVRCLTSPESQKQYMLSAKLPAARAAVYDAPDVRRAFPMAELIRDSIASAGPRPVTPYYTDVSSAVVRTFHPPSAVDPQSTPEAAAELITLVLHDRALL